MGETRERLGGLAAVVRERYLGAVEAHYDDVEHESEAIGWRCHTRCCMQRMDDM
ncbi:MAG: hypothetical protein N2595_03335 [bacterium]|nr:hypothetical protein [bacterium]